MESRSRCNFWKMLASALAVLAAANIPSSVASIGSYAFNGCTSLASVSFAAGSALGSIGNYAFAGCTSLA